MNYNAAHERLLDMLSGWVDLLDRSGFSDEAEEIRSLYQKAGSLYNLATEAETEEFTKNFLLNEVLPVILGEKKP